MRDLLIGIDAGTSMIKSVAFDLSGRQLASAELPNSYDKVEGGGAVQDADRTWADTVRTLNELSDKVDNLRTRVAAVAVTGQGDGTWLIDKAGDPVCKGLLWLDARAGSIVNRLRRAAGEAERFNHTGTGLAACQQGPQLLWLQEEMPEILARATTGFHCKDWLYYKLTGKRATDPSEAVFTFGDFRNRNYSDTVIGFLGLEQQRHLLPEIVDGATRSHPLTDSTATLLGLLPGTPVVLGYVDVACTALGAGLFDLGADTGCSVLGSTGMHMRLAKRSEDISLNDDLTGYTICMPVRGAYAQVQSNMAATLNIDWILSVAGSLLKSLDIEMSKSELLRQTEMWLSEAMSRPPLYHPYISEAGERGPFIDPSARSSFIGLTVQHGFPDLVRAVFEGMVMAARDCYSAMGPLPEQVRLSGGAARSASLRRLLGGALGARIQTSEREEAGAAGAAMIAAVSLGHYQTMEDCVKEWVTPYLRAAEPVDDDFARYFEAVFLSYQESRRALSPVWKTIAKQQDMSE